MFKYDIVKKNKICCGGYCCEKDETGYFCIAVRYYYNGIAPVGELSKINFGHGFSKVLTLFDGLGDFFSVKAKAEEIKQDA